MEARPQPMTVKELSAFLRISDDTLYVALERGEIPGARKIGAQWRIAPSVLHAWLSGRTAPNDTWPATAPERGR